MTEDFEDFVRERREQSEQTRRMLIGVLAGTCIALAVSNVALALWITAGRARPTVEVPTRAATRETSRAAPVAESPPPSASIPAPAERADPPPSVTLPRMTEPSAATAESRVPSTQADRAARADAPRAEAARTDAAARAETRTQPPPPAQAPSSARDLPARATAPAATPRAAAAASARAPSTTALRMSANAAPSPARAMPTTPAGLGFAAPEEATAAWMLSTYGRADAEARARAAQQFYDARSAEGRYWNRVLVLITAAR
jgi:hypothetical protein